MYNEEQKAQFMQEKYKSESTYKVAAHVMSRLEPFEEAAGKDFVTMTVEELQPIADQIFGLRSNSKSTLISVLNEYMRWCIAHKVPGANRNIQKVDLSGIDRIREQMVSSPLQLQNYLNVLFSPESHNMQDNTYRCWFWMGFAGMHPDEAYDVRESEVNFTAMEIQKNGRSYPIYREAVPAFYNAVNLREFQYRHENPFYMRLSTRLPGDSIMRGVKMTGRRLTTDESMVRLARKKFSSGETTKNLSFNRMIISGILYRIYEKELAGEPVDFTEVARDALRKKLTPEEEITKTRVRVTANQCKTDYQNWKQAFIAL